MTVVANAYLAEAERLATEHTRRVPAWLAGMRRDALSDFERLGFPTTRDEEWRFTSVAPIGDGRFTIAADATRGVPAERVNELGWSGEVAATLVFVDGRYVEVGSQPGRFPARTRVESLVSALARDERQVETYLGSQADPSRHAFTALNTAFVDDGAFIYVPDGVTIDRPIHLLFLSGTESATMAHPRVVVVLGANSSATVVENYASYGHGPRLTNAVTEIVAGENATLHHYKIQRENSASFHVGTMYLAASRHSTTTCHSVSLGGALVRNDVKVVLDGEGSTCTLNGVYVSDGTRLVDNHTTIDHAKPHCDSREVYRGVLADRSRGVFNGKIIVRPDAQKTDAKQTSKALLLSPDAQINTKPELEIFANDVKCTHGAAIGQIDDDAVFYLRARGLDEQQAREMLIRAFAGDVLNEVPIEELRTMLDRAIVARLPRWRG